MGLDNEFADPIVFDVETIGSPDAESMLDPVRPPANYRDEFKIKTYVQDKLAERIATASLEPDLCEIVALGAMRAGTDMVVMTRKDLDEAFLLSWFWDTVTNCRLIGYNILQFDIPVLIRRSQLLGVKHPVVNLDRYRSPHIDLMQRLSFNGAITFRSLNFYARRFGLDCDDDTVVGADIPKLVVDGEWDAIRDHCACDIQKTALLAERLGWFKVTQRNAA